MQKPLGSSMKPYVCTFIYLHLLNELQNTLSIFDSLLASVVLHSPKKVCCVSLTQSTVFQQLCGEQYWFTFINNAHMLPRYLLANPKLYHASNSTKHTE